MPHRIPSRVHTSRARTLLLTSAALAALVACSDGRLTEAAVEPPGPGLPGLLPAGATASAGLTAPTPTIGDRILFDARASLQQAADLGAALALWGYSSTTRSQWGFTTDMDGSGTNALRVDWASSGGSCLTQSPEITRTMPKPYPKRAYMQWKQRLGRTATGGGVGTIGAFDVFRPECGRAGRYIWMAKLNGSADRVEVKWRGPEPVSPAVSVRGTSTVLVPAPDAGFDPQAHTNETLLHTLYVQAQSSSTVPDGVIRLWVNGQLVIDQSNVATGIDGIYRILFPWTAPAPIASQSEYFWDIVAWEPTALPATPMRVLTLTPSSATLLAGDTTRLSLTLISSTGDTTPVTQATWETRDPLIATVSPAGLVTAVSPGTVTITATSDGLSTSASIVVRLATVAVTSLDLTPASLTMRAGTTAQLTATPRDANGNAITGRSTTWISSNPAIASVNADGLVTGVGPGVAQITATCEGSSATSSVSVEANATAPGEPCTTWPAAIAPPMPQSTGTAFYVAPTGSDANSGTIGAPWKTLQKAFNTLQPGQTAYLRAGTYGTKCAATTFARAGTASAPITVRGYQGERAVLNGQVRLDGSYFRLSHIVMEGPSCGTWGDTGRLGENLILMTPGKTHHIEVSHSEVLHGGWHAGISAGGDDIWILNNYIHDNGNFNDPDQWNTSHGIYYHNGSRGVIANNILEHNFAKGISARYAGNHVLVLNNTIVGNGRSGIDITEDTHDWIMANNIIMNNGNTGIHTSGSSGGTSNVLRNNVFWKNGSSGTSHWHTNNTRIDNLVADPLLVNPVTRTLTTTHVAYSNDYRLRAGSPAIDFALASHAPPADLYGVCRLLDGRPDVGAINYMP